MVDYQRFATAAMVAALCLTAACSGGDAPDRRSAHDGHAAPSGAATEQRRATPRLAVTYDGGVQILDAATLSEVADFPADGYLRVNPAGDGRHVFLTEANVFTLMDLGSWSVPHGDHRHFYSAQPRRTGVRIEAPEPGHVVRHEGRTVLFSDGTGTATSIPTAKIGDADAPRSVYRAPSPHHGVAVQRADGSLLVTVGNEKARSGIAVLDTNRAVLAQSEQCPGVHGEGAASSGVIVFGCEDGVLAVTGNTITKIAAPTPGYARTGTIAATAAHPVALGDYKVDKAADPERPTRVSLIDTARGQIRLVDLPASYSFRSLARGQFGEALVVGTDGVLRIIDPDTGATTGQVKATAPWTEPQDWQQPRPSLFVLGSTAYITEPATKTIVAVDIPTAKEIRRGSLDHAPDEVTGVPGVTAGG